MVIYERFEENEYLESFYQHLKAHGLTYNPYSYKTQLKFLQTRIKQEIEVFSDSTKGDTSKSTYIVDRSIFEDSAVFAKSQFKSGLMSQEEFAKYNTFFQETLKTIRFPDLVIYLKIDAKKLHERIQNRGREMEKEISEEYLRSLDSLYDTFIRDMEHRGAQILEISTETREDYPLVVERIKRLLDA